MLEFAALAKDAKAHIKIRATFVDMTVGTVLTFFTFLFHEIWTYLQVVTKVALITITALTSTLKFIAWFYLAFIMRMRTII